MTSENLSFHDKLKNHRTYINRTLWTGYVALPFVAAYFILGVIMMVSRSINYAEIYHQTSDVLYQEKIRAAARILGFEGISWLFVIGIAVMFALQGFSYVFNQSQLDFYLSQPTTRAQRIRRNYFNAFSTFLIMYIGCELLAALVATAMGAMNSVLLCAILIQTLMSIILFFAFYNITVLAVMLSGTLPIAILLTACFSFISIVVSGEIYLYKEIFFATHSSSEPLKAYLSPLYDVFSTLMDLARNSSRGNALLSMDYISSALKIIIPSYGDILLVGVIAFVFVVIFSRNRKSEWAGKSIPLTPFRWLVKIAACIVMGLGSGYFVYIVYDSVWNSRLYVMMLVVMVITTILTGSIAEVILERNIKRFLKGKAQTIMALAIVVLVFVIFRGDLLGYDSFVPAADKVASGALINDTRNFNMYHQGYYGDVYSSDADTMFITDSESLIKIAYEGMNTRKLGVKNQAAGIYKNMGYDTTVLFRLKNGRKVYRYITVPYSVVDDELDKIVSGEEYKKGHFDVFRDEMIRAADEKSVDHSLRYVADGSEESQAVYRFSYAELSDAYRKDLLENYRFSYVKDHMPIGTIEYDSNEPDYIYGSLDVFDTFENTKALLKKYGLYASEKYDIADVREVTVTNYYPGYDLEKEEAPNIDGTVVVDSTSKTYTDQDKIKEILLGTVSTNYYNPWYNYSAVNDQYSVEVYLDTDRSSYGGRYYSLLKGKVPDFVAADTNN